MSVRAQVSLALILSLGLLWTAEEARADCKSPAQKECGNVALGPCPFPGTVETFPGVCHPYPQQRPKGSVQNTPGCTSGNSETCCDNGRCETTVDTGEGIYPPCNPFCYETFPGNNLIPNVYTNMFDGAGNEMVNTLPSTPDIPYNLHDGDPIVREINPLSPADDLINIFRQILMKAFDLAEGPDGKITDPALREALLGVLYRDVTVPEFYDLLGHRKTDRFRGPEYEEQDLKVERELVARMTQVGIDILEGNPVPNRYYSGFPLLHYAGPEKVGKVQPIRDARGQIIGGNVDVHQIWYEQHIEADTSFLDTTPILFDENCRRLKDADGNDLNVPWTVTYTVDVLNRGHDDFSPFVTYFDPFAPDPDNPGQTKKAPHIGMDQTFFDMEDGTRTIFKIKMAPAQYLNLVYTWGWRMHPPRIQVMENTTEAVNYGGKPHPACEDDYEGCLLPQLEKGIFCNPDDPGYGGPGAEGERPSALTCLASPQCKLRTCSKVRCAPGEPQYDAHGNPTQCRKNQLYAIGRLGELAPAKRMWTALRKVQELLRHERYEEVIRVVNKQALPAYYDWQDRTLLPEGFEPDPASDITIAYINNTIYGQLTDGAIVRWNEWEERPATLNVTAYNGDHFTHAYNIADFGANRGWENQFKSSVKVAGSGCWFTFGRAHWWLPVGGGNGFLCVPPVGSTAEPEPGKHRFAVTFNYDPSRRLRFYQFDPFHHDVAIFSVH